MFVVWVCPQCGEIMDSVENIQEHFMQPCPDDAAQQRIFDKTVELPERLRARLIITPIQ